MTAKVAVITPTKNRVKLLCETIDSVQQQAFGDWEHIIVDDGSDDGTREEVLRRAALDRRIRYIERTGSKAGANVCRNLGVRESKADLIVFLDSDDLFAPDCLGRRVAAMENNADLDFAVFPCWVFQGSVTDLKPYPVRPIGSDLDCLLYLEHPWLITGPIWRRSSLMRVGLFSEELLSWQDVDLNVRALAAGAKYLKFDARDHYIRWTYDLTKVSANQFRAHAHLHGAKAIVEGFRARLEAAGLMDWTRHRALAGLMFLLAERWLRIGEYRQSLRTWRHARNSGLVGTRLYAMGILVLAIFKTGMLGPTYSERLLDRFKFATRLRLQPPL